MKGISFLLFLLFCGSNGLAQEKTNGEPTRELVKCYKYFEKGNPDTGYTIAELPSVIPQQPIYGFFNWKQAANYYRENDKETSLQLLEDKYRSDAKVFFINPYKYGRDLLEDVVDKNKYYAKMSVCLAGLSEDNFDLVKDNRLDILPDGLKRICKEILKDSTVTFINNPLQVSVVNDAVNFNPNFIKWLFIISMNEKRVDYSRFNELINNPKELDHYCKGRTATLEGYDRFYNNIAADFINNLTFIYDIAREACQQYATMSNDGINNFELQALRKTGIHPLVYQKLLNLAYAHYGNTTQSGIFINGDFGARFENADENYSEFERW